MTKSGLPGPVYSNKSKAYVYVSKIYEGVGHCPRRFDVVVFLRSDGDVVSYIPTKYTVSGDSKCLDSFQQAIHRFYSIGILGKQMEKCRRDDWIIIKDYSRSVQDST